MIKIALIIAFRDFRDEEYFITKQILEEKGISTKTFSTSLGTAFGSYGGEVKVEEVLNKLNIKEFDGIVFVGGAGCYKFMEEELIYQIVRDIVKENKILGAICAAPAILAKAGVLIGKKATVWSSNMDKSLLKLLKENGAKYEEKDVILDGNIVTANGVEATEKFAQVLTGILKNI